MGIALAVVLKAMSVMSNPQGYGDMIRSARKERGKSLRSFSSEVGVSTGYLSYVEREVDRPGAELCIRIAEALDLDADRLLTAAGHVPPDVLEILVERPDLAPKVRRMARA